MLPQAQTVVILNVRPCLEGGRYPVKRVVGDRLEVEADILTHGHDVLQARLRARPAGAAEWQESEMVPVDNDRWRGGVHLTRNTTWEYTVLAWRDPFLSWAADLRKRLAAGQDLTAELTDGRALVAAAAERATEPDRSRLRQLAEAFDGPVGATAALERTVALLEEAEAAAAAGSPNTDRLAQARAILASLLGGKPLALPGGDPVADTILGAELEGLMRCWSDRGQAGTLDRPLEVIVDRPEAEFGAWYEMWARSQGTVEGRGATFADMTRRLPEIQEMGFSVLYLPPIHPIGQTHRKGPNNSLVCPPGSPGCPYAIGNELGGHTAVDPELGTLDDFRRFEAACRAHGLEIAMDLALQASPDHPWVREHPDWFRRRPDGSIRYAENPPKKYEDIYPLDFDTPDRAGLWQAVLGVVRFWMSQGVRIFRVDNPHTKPVAFWEWLLAEVRTTDPDVIFLSEAFTRPKMMKVLAMAGFTQSYTYFTWRNFKAELTEYFTELCQGEPAEYMRGNLFTNTPDILPLILQHAPRSAFKMRAVLAATLGSTWGIYNGFELCEGTPLPGKEEYKDSEKYQYKVWDWNRPGHIKEFIGRLNRVRGEQPALRRFRNLSFLEADNDSILFYAKQAPEADNHILVAVNLDPFQPQDAHVRVPLAELGIRPDETYQMHDLLTGRRFFWQGERNYIRLDPTDQVAHLFRLMRWSHREQDFDYFI